MEKRNLQIYFFTGLTLLALAIVVFMFLPFLASIVIAATFAVIFEPIHNKILKLVKGQKSIASLLTILSILIIVFVPVTLLGLNVFNQAQDLYVKITSANAKVNPITQIETTLEKKIQTFFPKLTVDLNLDGTIKSFFGWFTDNIGPIFSGLAHVLMSFLLSLLAIYYLLKDGDRLKKAIFKISPLDNEYNEKIFSTLKLTIKSVISGSLIVALSQGLLAGIGFTIFGVPNAALWGFTTVIAALVPILGTSLVLAPIIAYLFIFSNLFSAIGLLVWALIAVGLIDNFIGPKLIQRRVQIHSFFILLSVLGGVSFFGAMGFLIGPLFLAFFFTLVELYPSLILHKD